MNSAFRLTLALVVLMMLDVVYGRYYSPNYGSNYHHQGQQGYSNHQQPPQQGPGVPHGPQPQLGGYPTHDQNVHGSHGYNQPNYPQPNVPNYPQPNHQYGQGGHGQQHYGGYKTHGY